VHESFHSQLKRGEMSLTEYHQVICKTEVYQFHAFAHRMIPKLGLLCIIEEGTREIFHDHYE